MIADEDTTSKDLIAQGSTLGLILKMMHLVDHEDLSFAIRQRDEGELIGATLVRLGTITDDERNRACEWQRRMREATSMPQIIDLLAEVEETECDARAALFAAITNTETQR